MGLGKSYKIGAIIAGATVGVVMIGYVAYLKRRRNQAEDADEGIGDVDSIISEGEVEEAALARIPSGTRVSTSDEKMANKPAEASTKMSKAEIPPIVQKTDERSDRQGLESVKILILGLDGSGKTSMLNMLACKVNPETYQPTNGFNAVQVEKEEVNLNFVEVGGNSSTRSYWKNFTNDSDLLVYVVDGADKLRYQEAKSILKDFLDVVAFNDIAFLLVSNKQDLEEACKIDEIFNDADLKDVAKKGISTITLLNTVCVVNGKERNVYKETLMDVMLDLVLHRTS